MVDLRDQMISLMKRVRERGQLPPSDVIVRETLESLGYTQAELGQKQALEQFNDLLRKAWEETLPTLERYEERAFAEGIPRGLAEEFPEYFDRAERLAESQGFQNGVVSLFKELYPMLRRAFQSVDQGRKTRGGKDFELQIEGLLSIANVPFHKQDRRTRTDLILPSKDVYDANKNVSAIVSIKRTLRERWQEVAQELFSLRSPNVFLFTADEAVTQNHVRRICDEYNIYLVVWDKVKSAKFAFEPLVLGYTEWATNRLPILMQNWN